MSGRAYTMKELKGIVEYIKERKGYGETKGRKMWVDFANSGNTTRTWQSLKETFLKRILPDIHNPYYKLASDELRSFRAGSNLTKSDRRLEVHSSDMPEVPSHTDEEEKFVKAIPNYNGDVGNAKGEEPNINTDVHRDSIETLILDCNEPCYHSTQDIIRDLESPVNERLVNSISPAKSIRDVFTYSEPLTPMIQEIFHDFETDESNTVDNKLTDHNKNPSAYLQNTYGRDSLSVPKDIPDNKSNNESGKNKRGDKKQKRIKTSQKEQKPAQNMRMENTLEEVKSIVNENRHSKETDTGTRKIDVSSLKQNDASQPVYPDNLKQVNSLAVENSQNCHNTGLTDSSIPNNQEALNKNNPKVSETLQLSSESDLNGIVKNSTAKTKSRNSSSHSEEKTSKTTKTNLNGESVVKVRGDKYNNQTKNNNVTVTNLKQVSGAENKNLQVNEEQYVEPIVKIINNSAISNDDLSGQNINNHVSEQESDSSKKAHGQIVSEKCNKNKDYSHSQVDNPCLQSISLGEKAKHSFTQENNRRFAPENNVILLDSHSGSETSNSLKVSPLKRKRENSKVLAKVFGFSNGAGNHKPKTRVVSSTISDSNDYTETISSDSSRWTSDDDTEFVTSPRKNRRSRKYLNPGSCKIIPLEHGGGLVVAYKGRIYPLIKEERNIKGRELKYMSYAPNKNAEDGVSYWRKKYFEEKKKARKLSSKLVDKKRSSRIIRDSTSMDSKESDQNVPQVPDHAIVDRTLRGTKKVVQRKEIQTDQNKDEKAIKIKIHSDNKEVAIEGQWQNMAPILSNIMHLFDKEPQVKTNDNNDDEDVKEKISRIEEEIFREIEEMEKSSPGNTRQSVSSTKSLPHVKELPSTIEPAEDNFIHNTKSEQKLKAEDVTNSRKRGRPKKYEEEIVNNQVDPSPVKKRISRQMIRESEDEIIVNEAKLQLVEDIIETNRKPTPRKHTNIRRNEALQRKSILIDSDDSTIGYKFPSPERKMPKIPINKKGLPRTPKKVKKTYNPENPTQKCSSAMHLYESSQISAESSYGYQDSDCSPGLILKKRRLNFPTHKNKLRLEARRKSFRRHKLKCYSSTSESNLSSFPISLQKSNDSSLNTAIYKTDSYQLLWTKKDKPPFKGSLQKIMEVTPMVDEFTKELNDLNLSPAPQTITEIDHKINSIHENDNSKDTSKTKTDIGNSSNVSLPPSPELSIVENVSVGRSEIMHTDVHPTLNELQANSLPNTISLHMSIVSKEIHSSDPLMDQDFDFTTSHIEICLDEENQDISKKQNNLVACTNDTVDMKMGQSPNLATTVSDSLINEIRTVNINDVSDALHQKFNNLLLESTKKNEISKRKSRTCDEKKTTTVVSSSSQENEKKKFRKRCSTPHKKTTKKKSTLATVEPVIEEHMEYCAPKTRKSCPPSILINNGHVDIEDAMPVNADKSAKKRKQKEIIKVKILKPKKRCDQLSLQNDSGINDSEMGVFESLLNDSVDLIHNHSDTCLNTYDCLQSNSVIITENSSQDVISLISDTSQTNELDIDHSQEILKVTSSKYFSSDAQDGSVTSNDHVQIRDIASFPKAVHKTMSANNEKASSIISSPLSYNSLITEDLSDEAPISRMSEWYLLSEDDCTNTNLVSLEKVNYRPYLEKLFPVTCAVPDLSTITEASREADVLKEAKTKSVNNCELLT